MAKATKFTLTPDQQDEYLEHIRAGMRRGAAADIMELSRIKMREYIFETPEFEKRVQDAEVDATEHIEEALYQAAVSGNVTACKVWMELKGYGGGISANVGTSSPAPSAPTPPTGFGDLDAAPVVDIRARRRRE